MTNKSILLFDGVCNLCNGVVKFVIKQDKKSTIKFAALQSDSGQKILKSHQLSIKDFDTFIFISEEKLYTRSTAALKVMNSLGSGWKFFNIFFILPTPIRDWIYNLIAKNRYKIFGVKESCMVPTPDIIERFLD